MARGPIGGLRKALKGQCPTGTIWGIDFVGASFLEVIVPGGREQEVISVLERSGMKFCPTYSALHGIEGIREAKIDTTRNRVKLLGCIRRMNRLLQFTTHEGAAKYYTDTLLEAEAKLIIIQKEESPQESPAEKESASQDDGFIIYSRRRSPEKSRSSRRI